MASTTGSSGNGSSSTTATKSSSYSYSYALLVAWYVLFGALHELSHVIVAILLQKEGNNYSSTSVLSSSLAAAASNNNINWIHLVARIALSRQVPLDLEEHDDDSHVIFWVRHAGWVTSVLLAVGTYMYFSFCKKNSNNQEYDYEYARLMFAAAAMTALEAVTTDLLGIPTIPFLPNSTIHHSSSSYTTTFFCGNFGIILLHQAWWKADGGKSALDVLEKMVLVTSMRGAQSGGVITLHKNGAWQRTRVVNLKRTCLATLLRKKLQRNKTSFASLPSSTTVIAGHTRFATSSKATLQGTHPQQWTPPTKWQVWKPSSQTSNTNSINNSALIIEPVATVVENFITHNGDFEYYTHGGKTYDLHAIQSFLSIVTGIATPAPVDSCAVAGMLDVLRCKGCFALSARYALCLALSPPSSAMATILQGGSFPSKSHLEAIGNVFDDVLREMLKQTDFDKINADDKIRESFARRVESRLEARRDELIRPLGNHITNVGGCDDPEEQIGAGASLLAFCMTTIHAFFDNDLFMSMKLFLEHARGSFGLCFASNLDGDRQICLAARGQTMSVAFYPNTGLICYGSEQAAVKAGMTATFPGDVNVLGRSRGEIDNDGLRLDLDDLGGEIILLDWAANSPQTTTTTSTAHPVSRPNQHLPQYELMLGKVTAILYQQSKGTAVDALLYHRMTRLTRNRFIRALKEEPEDIILADIQDIPKVCRTIQDDWHADKACISLNRLTAFHLSRCLRERLEARISGRSPDNAVDILLTGCEVSLWVAEQFASDLQKTFPRLRISAVSSNKLLGTYGQGISIPSLGFPYSRKTHNLHDAIVIIVSHSGGTFAPLACSSLLQSATKNLFVVTSEWDTQIGKQLRKMDAIDDSDAGHMFKSRIFSTEVGMRPAEPCSVSLVATHQLLTNLFEYICVIVLSDARYRRATGALISEQDLLILEKCNQKNIEALADIVGMSAGGVSMESINDRAEVNLRAAGDLWAEHILENARAYIMSFIYVFVTVTCGYPLLYGIASAAGVDSESHFMYLIRFFDAAIYFWLPQINVTIVRIAQGRNLLHRMVGRTVVIGDIPWVAASAEAFLSKIFAVSYSIAGLNVLSGNPVDHFVHRHTHRVTRGTLVLCGRPDGRLSALATAEAAVCLSVNQASSIQSWGGTCESVTIGHNPSKLPLSANAIFLKRKRPLFLCERMLVETDAKDEAKLDALSETQHSSTNHTEVKSGFLNLFRFRQETIDPLDMPSIHDPSVRPRVNKYRSAAALLGVYTSAEEANTSTQASDGNEDRLIVDEIVEEAIREKKFSDRAHILFQTFDKHDRGTVTEDQFIEGTLKLKTGLTEDELRALFKVYDQDGESEIDYHEFLELMNDAGLGSGIQLPPSNRDERGIIRIEPSKEKYFGETIRKNNAGKSGLDLDFRASRSQHFVQELYETRVASMQRFVAITVLSHQMGKRVEQFFHRISFGWLGYRMDRTHSIMRIATTASPVSGADVKEQMRHMQLLKRVQYSVHVISLAYLRYKANKQATISLSE